MIESMSGNRPPTWTDTIRPIIEAKKRMRRVYGLVPTHIVMDRTALDALKIVVVQDFIDGGSTPEDAQRVADRLENEMRFIGLRIVLRPGPIELQHRRTEDDIDTVIASEPVT